MKRLLVSLMVLGFVASLTAFAEGDKAAGKSAASKPVVEKKAEQPLVDITVTGKLSKKEGPKAKYELTTTDGQKIMLPEVKAEVADLEKMVGKDVKIVGKGPEGKKVHLKSITSAEVVEAAAAAPAAQAAPAAAPEAPAK